jgi:hypothetical protein
MSFFVKIVNRCRVLTHYRGINGFSTLKSSLLYHVYLLTRILAGYKINNHRQKAIPAAQLMTYHPKCGATVRLLFPTSPYPECIISLSRGATAL